MSTPRALLSFDTSRLDRIETDLCVIGSGVAGMRAALEAARHGRVLLLTKAALVESNTRYAQGGVAVPMSRGDSVRSHVEDTLQAGHGLCDRRIVEGVIRDAVPRIEELLEWGARFDRVAGRLDFTREGGHSRARILHAGGDATGQAIVDCLVDRVRATSNIQVLENTFCLDLLVRHGECRGALVSIGGKIPPHAIDASRTILATGGLGQLYRETTNPAIATGDGIAAAWRAGAVLEDMEFVQFHPTTFYVAGASRALISEAVRGEGAILRDKTGKRFMPEYHPMAELAPRDVVSRAIVRQIQITHDPSVYLDLTHLPARQVRERFPRLAELCRTFGIDIGKDLIPIRPSAHYFVGGVKIDANGRTSIPGLYAAGECGGARFHGANRLGSNSLLEGLVFGARAGAHAGERLPKKRRDFPRMRIEAGEGDALGINIVDASNSLRSLTWRSVGVEREERGLADAITRIDFWSGYLLRVSFGEPAGWELQNLLTLGRLISGAARRRRESRGTHFRSDFPIMDDGRWKRHLTWKR
ncbi:MAG: L-aspartate oxidase [Planctomycetes bacterium]|nr:L-aspartate oxidase [Planctomycetota bacterium]